MKIPTLALLLLLGLQCFAQDLPRRAFMGIMMEPVTEEVKSQLGLPEVKGVFIKKVVPGSSAEKSGIKEGDVLLKINGVALTSPTQTVALVTGKSGGENFTYELIRNSKTITGKSTFTQMPLEKYPDLQVLYTSANTPAGKLRMIVTKPKISGKLPVVAFIGGIGCYSLDSPFDSTRSEIQFLNTLARAGYMCVRLEKPGMGDNAGHSTPCTEIGFKQEVDSYVAAIQALKQQPDADSNALFIFGHSMGGVMAPMVAEQTPIKGIIAYGTLGSNFIEYLAKTRRTIALAYQLTPDETDDFIREFCQCAGYYFYDKMTTAAVAQKLESCTEYLSVFDLRSRVYNDELFALNIPALWKTYKGKALMLWGDADYVASKADHEIIATAINYYHPGHAEMMVVPNSAHGMELAHGFVEAKTKPGPYHPEVGKIVLQWLKKNS